MNMEPIFIKKLLGKMNDCPDKVAIVDRDGKRKTTYRELYDEARKVASYIQGHNVARQSFVAVKMPNCTENVSAQIGIWLSSCAVVPLGDSFPKSRVDYILENCDCQLVIDMELMNEIKKGSIGEVQLPSKDDNAILLYTSGSTGTPKGVLHTYRTLDFGLPERTILPGLWNEGDEVVYGTTAPLYFAAGLLMYDVLMYGGTVHLYSDDVKKDVHKLEEYILQNGLTISFISPAILTVFRNRSERLKTVICAGERLTSQHSKDGYTLINFIGQTETILPIASYKVPEHPLSSVPIGKCLFGAKFMIVDEDGKEVSAGEIGELCLKGDYCKEYYKDQERTAELYKDGWLHTKDLVRLGSDGLMYYVNRKDWMVKVNGQRVEPSEVECAMLQMQGMKGAVVKGFDNGEGSSFLCAYYIADAIKSEDIRKHLADCLPDYMIPTYFVKLDKFPLSANGKLDRLSLKAPDSSLVSAEYVAPSNETESTLCEAFAQVLGKEKVGVDDDFFLMGGDSIRVMKLQTIIKELNVSAKQLYANRTPRLLARSIGKDVKEGDMVVVQGNDRSRLISSKKMYLVNILMDFLPNSGCQNLKAKLFRWAGVKVGTGVRFFQGFKIQGIGEVEIGNNVFIGHQAMIMINEGSKVIIEDHAALGTRAMLITGFHNFTPYGDRIISEEGTCSTVRLCRGCGVSTGCMVLQNVTIGEKAFVGAGTVVTNDVKPYSLIGPAAYETHLQEGQLKYVKG